MNKIEFPEQIAGEKSRRNFMYGYKEAEKNTAQEKVEMLTEILAKAEGMVTAKEVRQLLKEYILGQNGTLEPNDACVD